jgi:Cu-Zn family superoxide dismutase
MKSIRFIAIAVAAPLFLLACGGSSQPEPEIAAPPPPPPPPPPAPEPTPEPEATPADVAPPAAAPKSLSVSLVSKSKSKVTGTVTLTEVEGGVKLAVQIANLKPGDHGMHVHEKADCSAPDAKSAGDHFNPSKHAHGMPDSDAKHLGDLGNVTASKDGTVSTEITVKGANLKEGDPSSFMGRSLVVHEKKDDGKSQPAGNSGARIGCAELKEPGPADEAAAAPDKAKPAEPAKPPAK